MTATTFNPTTTTSVSTSQQPLVSNLKVARTNQVNLLKNIVPTTLTVPEVSHEVFEQQAQEKILNAKSEASYSALGVITLSKDFHIDGEFQSLINWLKSFSNDKQQTTLNYLNEYKENLELSFESWATWQKSRTWAYSAGHTYSKSTSVKQDEAHSIRLNSGTVLDFYSPSIYSRCEDFTIQGRSYFLSSDFSRLSSLYSWNRAEKLSVLQTKTGITYATEDLYSYGTNTYRVSSSLLEQAEIAKFQVQGELSLLAGQFNSLIEDNWVVRANKLIWQQSQDSSYLVSNKSVFITAKEENHLSSVGETNIVAGTSMYLSSNSSSNISSKGVLSLSGSVVQIGSGSFSRPILDLDSNKILGGVSSLTSTGISGLSSSGIISAAGISVSSSAITNVATNAIKQAGVSDISDFLSDSGETNLGSMAKSAISSIVETSTASLDLSSIGLGEVNFSSATNLATEVASSVTNGNFSSLKSKLYQTGQTLIAKNINSLFGSDSSKATLPSAPTTETIPEAQELIDYSSISIPDLTTSTSNGWWVE